MKWLPAQLGAEPKKVAFLGGLLVVLIGVYFWTRESAPAAPLAVESPGAAAVPVIKSAPALVRQSPASALPSPSSPSSTPSPMAYQRTARRGENSIQDFRPTLKLPEGTDVSRIDPELHLDVLAMAHAQASAQSGASGRRSLFEFGNAPIPKPPKVDPVQPKPVVPPSTTAATPVTPPVPAGPPPTPPPPPIPLKFYGYVTGRAAAAALGAKRAFFLDGEDIIVAGENELVRNRYRIIRIDSNSAVVEDTTNKSQQTLPLTEEVPG